MEIPNAPKLTPIRINQMITPFLLDVILSDDQNIRPYVVNFQKIDHHYWGKSMMCNLVQTETF